MSCLTHALRSPTDSAPSVVRRYVVIVTTHDTGRHLGCYGVGTVRSEAIDVALPGIVSEALTEADLRPAATPSVQDTSTGSL